MGLGDFRPRRKQRIKVQKAEYAFVHIQPHHSLELSQQSVSLLCTFFPGFGQTNNTLFCFVFNTTLINPFAFFFNIKCSKMNVLRKCRSKCLMNHNNSSLIKFLKNLRQFYYNSQRAMLLGINGFNLSFDIID